MEDFLRIVSPATKAKMTEMAAASACRARLAAGCASLD